MFTLSADAIANPARYFLAGAWLGGVCLRLRSEKWQSCESEIAENRLQISGIKFKAFEETEMEFQ